MFTITNEKEVQPVGCVLPNTLVHGDCLEVMKYIPDGSIDLVLGNTHPTAESEQQPVSGIQ
jgi:hypothetical protein